MRIEFLEPKHMPQCSELFAQGYRDLRESAPEMPPRYELRDATLPMLERLHQRAPVVGAFGESGEIIGFLGGMLVPQLKGKDKGVYCPEWGHAVSLQAPDRQMVYRRMYEAIGDLWVRDRRINHAVTILAHDPQALDAWFWSTFGLLVVDMIRDLEPVPARTDGSVRVRAAGLGDVDRLFPVWAEHEMYYNRAPIWLPKEPVLDTAELVAYLDDPKTTIWLAEDVSDGTVLGMMKHSLDAEDACTVVRDPHTVACSGAYVLPAARNRSVGALLLGAIVDWAKEHGHERVSLDFEAANIYGSAFWRRHLKPVCYSVIRHVNDHMLAMLPDAR
jgi:GNAT superfamily N-acetyltransferase